MSSIPATPRTAALTNSISAIEMRLHLQQKEAFSSLQSQLAELLASRRQQEALLLARQGAQVPSPSQSAPNSPRQSLVNRVATTDLAASLLDSKLKQLKSSSSTKAKIKDGVEFSAKLSEKQHTIDQLHDEIKQLKSASPAADSSLIYGLMDLLLTLQPNMVINRIANLPGKLEPHFTMHPNSTLLFADISGYTALSQTLGSAGAAGTELLSKSLDDFFGIAITSIYKYNGDVIKFCGDALLCLFLPDRNTTPAEAAILASQCALELKAKLRFYKAAENVTLDLKQMLAHGDIIGNYVGDVSLHHFEFLVSGDALAQIAATEHYVNPGDIILSKEMHAIAHDEVAVKDVNAEATALGFKLLVDLHNPSSLAQSAKTPANVKLSSDKQSILALFNEPSIVEKLSVIAGSWSRLASSSAALRSRISRHDLCTIMFISIDSKKLNSTDPQTNLEGLNDAFMSFYSPSKLFGGTLRQFLTDDKGTVAIIVFSGRESNTISACRSAIKIQDNFADHGIDSNIGISTGKVFFGPVGDQNRCEMAWIGDSVNLAARLMGKAKDTVMVDKATCENASSDITFEMFGMVELKGKGAVALYELQGLKHRASVNDIGRLSSHNAVVKLTTRPQIFDNAVALFPSIASEISLNNARKKALQSFSFTLSREAAAFTISISRSWDSTADGYNPFLSLLRSSVIDFGGEFLSLSPYSPNSDLLLSGVFLTGELPIRQSGGANNLFNLSDATSNLLSFISYLTTDESFLDSTPPNSINAIAASVGMTTFDISSSQTTSTLTLCPAIDETLAILATLPLCGIHPNASAPRFFCTPEFTASVPQALAPSTSTYTPPAPQPAFDLLSTTGELSNPGIGMPLSFVRRFHNDKELEYANSWMTNALPPLLKAVVERGEVAEKASGCCYQSCILFFTFLSSPAKTSSPTAILSEYRAAIEIVIAELSKNGGEILSSSSTATHLHLTAVIAVPITSASFFVGKLAKQFSPDKIARLKEAKAQPRARMLFAIVHFGDIMWRTGVNGALVPFGPEVDEITAQSFHLLSVPPPDSPLLFCRSSAISMQTSTSRLISFTPIPSHPDYLAPHDVFTSAVTSVFTSSKMTGRRDIRKALATSLERLLLVNKTSVSVLEARAGFGKSMVANEIIAMSEKMALPHLVVRTVAGDEAILQVWTKLCHHLIDIVAWGSKAPLDLLKFLPPECTVNELSVLNDYLPADFRVIIEKDESNPDDEDDEDYNDNDADLVAKASIRLQLFSHLIRNLVVKVSPFIFVIEDLHWLDSSSWKLLVQATNQWGHGIMIVCTTRPVPSHMAFEYSELCKSPATRKDILDTLTSNDQATLMKRHLEKRASPKILDRLKSLSRGFPFLVVELLRDAAFDLKSAVLGASDTEVEALLGETKSEALITTKDPYTDEENATIESFMTMYRQESGWEEQQNIRGVAFYARDDEDGNIRQGKAQGIVHNSTGLGLLTNIVESARSSTHEFSNSGNTRVVVEDINDHSAVMKMDIAMNAPLQNRMVVFKYLWKEVSKGVFIYLSQSVEREDCPPVKGVVRIYIKFYVNLFTEIPNANATHETIMAMVDPGGIIPASLVNSGMVSYLGDINTHVDYYAKREDFGVPLLKNLVLKRLERMSTKKTLGIISVMGYAVHSVKHLSEIIKEDEAKVAADISDFCKAELLEVLDDGSLHFVHAFVAEVAFETMSHDDFVTAHVDAAACLELEMKMDPTKIYLYHVCANHYAKAKQLERAREYTTKAASVALASNNHVEAGWLLEQLLDLIRELGKFRKPAAPEFHDLVHEELHAYVNLGRLDDAEALLKRGTKSALSCFSGVGSGMSLSRAKKRAITPSLKILRSSEKAFLELQCRLWFEMLEESKADASPKKYLAILMQLVKTGMQSGKSNSFVLSLFALARMFVINGDKAQANRIGVMADQYTPDNAPLWLVGWSSYYRGEIRGSAGEFEEAANFLDQAHEDWYEAGEYKLWAMALRDYVYTLIIRGELTVARDVLVESLVNARNARCFDVLNELFELQVFVCVEMGEIKDCEAAVMLLGGGGDSKNADNIPEGDARNICGFTSGKHRLYLLPYTVALLQEGLIDADMGGRNIDKALMAIPKVIRDWSYCLPLFWCVSSYHHLIKVAKEHGQSTKMLVPKMAQVFKKLSVLAKRHPGAEPYKALCEGYLALAEGDYAKACGPNGCLNKAVLLSGEKECAIIGARSKVALAEAASREPLPARISLAMAALEVFQASKAYSDTVACVLLLAQLDPKNTEFREMARMNSRRKSSNRGSKGNSDSVINDLETLEDIPLAGRKEELITLIKAANSLRTSSGGGGENITIIIEAAGGMGKSALLKSFMKDVRISMHGLHMHTSSASQFEKSTAFYIWKKVFESMLKLYQTKTKEGGRGTERVVAQEVLLATLGDLVGPERARDLHPLLNPMLPFEFPDTAVTGTLSSSARLSQSMDFFYEILVNQKGKTLICLEDAHWADELSWGLVERCHEASDVMVVITTRPTDTGEDAGSMREFDESEGVEVMLLGALDETALRLHIAGLLEVEIISDQLLKLIENRTGGNLLYIQELVSSLIESGMLLYHENGVDLKSDVDELVVPDNVQAVIASRLAGLSPSQQSLLQTASVVGREFTLHTVMEVHPASEMLENIGNDMKEIVRKRLVERVVGGGGEESKVLQFSHKFVQESIYQSCLVSTRKHVHKGIAKLLELEKSCQLNNYYGLIAHHYFAAEEWRSAALYLQLNSEESEKLEMPKTVMDSLTKWMEIKKKLENSGSDSAINGRFASAREEEGIVYVTLGKANNKDLKFKDAYKYCLKGIERLGKPFPRSKVGKVKLLGVGLATLQYISTTGGKFTYDDNPSDAKVIYFDALYLVGMLCIRRLRDQLGFLTATILACQKNAPVRSRLELMQALALIAPSMRLFKIYDFSIKETNRLSLECKNEVVASAILNVVNGYAYSAKGELKQSAAAFKKASKDYMKQRDIEQWANAATFGAMSMFENGLGGKAEVVLLDSYEVAVENQNRTARMQIISVAKDVIAWGNVKSEACKKFVETVEKDPGSKGKGTAMAFIKWRLGMIDSDECMKDMKINQKKCKWQQTHLFLGDRATSTLGFLELYDWARTEGRKELGGTRLADVMKMVVDNVKFLEKLGTSYNYVLCWALLFRGCVLRRQGKAGKALHVLVEGVEAASSTNSRACLCYLWLERGYCEETLGVGATRRRGRESSMVERQTSKRESSSVTISGEGGNGEDCVASYMLAMDIAKESNMDFVWNRGRDKLVAKGVLKEEDGAAGAEKGKRQGGRGVSSSFSDVNEIGGESEFSGMRDISVRREVSVMVTEDGGSGREDGPSRAVRRSKGKRQSSLGLGNADLTALLGKEGAMVKGEVKEDAVKKGGGRKASISFGAGDELLN